MEMDPPLQAEPQSPEEELITEGLPSTNLLAPGSPFSVSLEPPLKPAEPESKPAMPVTTAAVVPKPVQKLLPPRVPTPKQQSWGAMLSIILIVAMVVIGAFYSWGKRIAENKYPAETQTP